LYLGRIKKSENIIKFIKKYSPIHLFSNLLLVKKINMPGKDKRDIKIIGTI
tara:strand:- start:18 stop:170 length:153 start_codon:yes stop_codon:yes gene_type:complete